MRTGLRFEVIGFFSLIYETYAHLATRGKLIIDLYRKDNAALGLCVDSVHVHK